jgi:hypothetical protein
MTPAERLLYIALVFRAVALAEAGYRVGVFGGPPMMMRSLRQSAAADAAALGISQERMIELTGMAMTEAAVFLRAVLVGVHLDRPTVPEIYWSTLDAALGGDDAGR